ncbi:MAG: hypothetical protein AB7U61_00635 [Methylocystis sp.]
MTSVSPLSHPPQNFPDWRFARLEIEHDSPKQSVWVNYHADSPHCYRLRMLLDAIEFRAALKNLMKAEGASRPICDVVMASKKPRAFGLGGDLATFVSCISRNVRESLLTYAQACIEIIYALPAAFDPLVLKPSVVSGRRMRGGLEGARATDFVLAEEGARLGARTQRIISAGGVYSDRELFDLHIIDLVSARSRLVGDGPPVDKRGAAKNPPSSEED